MPQGVYPEANAKTAGWEISSTYEGRHVTLEESLLIHPVGAGSGLVIKGDPVVFGTTGLQGVGVAFKGAAAATDLIAIDTEGIWVQSVVANNDDGGSAVRVGDPLYISFTTAVISKIAARATNIPFGYALGNIDSGLTRTIAVKVHYDPLPGLNQVGTTQMVDEAVTVGKMADMGLEAHILVADAGLRPVSVAVSGDATIAASGAVALATNSVAANEIVDGSVTLAKLAVPKYGVVSQEVAVADFTDGGGTTGYVDLTDTLPAGAVPLGWKAVVSGAFGGDTTAVVQLGIDGDVDRFSAYTAGSVFTSPATVGSLAIAADACLGIDAAVTVRVTVTGGADFTSIVSDGNGVMTVSVYYVQTA